MQGMSLSSEWVSEKGALHCQTMWYISPRLALLQEEDYSFCEKSLLFLTCGNFLCTLYTVGIIFIYRVTMKECVCRKRVKSEVISIWWHKNMVHNCRRKKIIGDHHFPLITEKIIDVNKKATWGHYTIKPQTVPLKKAKRNNTLSWHMH